jgi:hypothetical protein
MNEPVPVQIPHTNASVDEVRLLGTLNLPLKPAQRESLIAEVARVLRPGGRLFVHVLAGESEVENPELPGPAGAVRAVPFETEPVTLLENAGFVRVRMMKFDAKPCFVRGGVGMRELQLEGFAPSASDETMVEVMYRGPFQEVRDGGRGYPRGRRVIVPATVAVELQTGVLSGQFVVFEPTTSRPSVVTACHS